MDEDEDVEAAERWEGIPKIEKMERKMSFGEICVGEWGEVPGRRWWVRIESCGCAGWRLGGERHLGDGR